MAATHVITSRFSQSGESLSYDKTYSASGRIDVVGESVAGETTDAEIAFAVDVDAVVSFFMVSNKDVTVESNDGSSPDETLTLTANIPCRATINFPH